MRHLALVLAALAFACSSSPAPKKLVLLHTNDEHSHLLGFAPEFDDFPAPTAAGTGVIKGGAARRAVVLAAQRSAATSAGADSLTVSAGDNLMGTLYQIAATSASADYRVMGPKYLKYDVTTLGNHEFDYGPNNLAKSMSAAKASDGMPAVVASNIHFSGTAGDADLAALFDELGTDTSKLIHRKLVVTTKSGIKVGFVGIMGADAATLAPLKAPTRFSLPAGITDDSNRIAVLSQIYDDIQPVVDSLHGDDQVDVVVALSHSSSYPTNPISGEDVSIAQNVSGIDVIVSGHVHIDVPAALVTNQRSHKQVLVQQAGSFGDHVGVISLSVDSNHNVTFDMTASHLIAVDDTIVPDPTVSAFVGGVMQALETTPAGPNLPSFLALTLTELLQAPLADFTTPGQYYNYALTKIGYDIDNTHLHQETALLDLAADSQLAAANSIAPTQIAFEVSGDMRVAAIAKGKTGTLGFGDLFMAVPLGASPVSGTPGYPLCRFALFLAEIKAAFEVGAGLSYSNDILFVVPSGFKFEYDTTRPLFNPSGDPLDKSNGRVTKIYKLKTASLAAGNFDGDYDLIFDASAPGSGWINVSPFQLIAAASNLYIATFATFAGIHLKDPNTGSPVAGNDPNLTILKRGDSTEIKEWEAVGSYVRALAAANTGNPGTLPPKYDKNDAGSVIPRRSICTGANATSGFCAK
jgi:5'-nucleotidase